MILFTFDVLFVCFPIVADPKCVCFKVAMQPLVRLAPRNNNAGQGNDGGESYPKGIQRYLRISLFL